MEGNKTNIKGTTKVEDLAKWNNMLREIMEFLINWKN